MSRPAQRWLLLLRGINVGGRNKLPMAALTHLIESFGCEQVVTYIQSGNVVFALGQRQVTTLLTRLPDAIAVEFGFRPQMLVLSREDVVAALEANPFPDVNHPKTLHFFFLDEVPASLDLDGLHRLCTQGEQFELQDRTFYLHTPNGFGRSQVASAVERTLGVAATARNLSTVQKLVELLGGT